MSDQIVKLDAGEWQQVMNALIAAHPLLMKIADQLRRQQDEAEIRKQDITINKPSARTDGKEAEHD